MDDLIRVVAKLLLQLRADRFGITGHVAVKRVQCGGLSGHDLHRVGIGFENGHGDQRHCQTIEHHHRLHHGAGEFRILRLNSQTRQDAATNQQQPDHREQAQRSDDHRSGDPKRNIEEGFKH